MASASSAVYFPFVVIAILHSHPSNHLSKVKRYSSPEQVISELRDVACHMGPHSVTCHPMQVNAHRTTEPDRLVLDLPTLEG